MSDFTYLYLHTHFSLGGGPASPAAWCKAAAELGYTTLGTTERSPLAGLPAFKKAARQAGLRPLYGLELDVLLDGTNPQPVALFARNAVGLDNLTALASVAYAEWPAKEQAVAWGVLAAHSAGLVLALLGSGGGSLSPFCEAAPNTQNDIAASLKEHFGDVAFVGLCLSGGPEDGPTADKVVEAAARAGLPLLALPPARYIRTENAHAYRALRLARERVGWGPAEAVPSTGEHLRAPGDVAAIFARWPEAVENAARVAQLCSGALDAEWPQPLSAGPADRARLESIARERLLKLLGTDSLADEAAQRLSEELDALEKSRSLPAWLALASLSKIAREPAGGEPAVPLGAPLGTADGSLLAYALGVSPVDPLPYSRPWWLVAGDTGDTLPVLPPPGVEVPANRRDAMLARLANEHTAGHLAFGACPVDIDAVTAVWAACRVEGIAPDESRALALKAVAGGWQALADDGGHSPTALALSLKGAPVTFKPDADTLVVAAGTADSPGLPLLQREGQPGGWVPWSEEVVAALRLPSLASRPSSTLALLDTALAYASQYPVPGLAPTDLDLATFPQLGSEAWERVLHGEITGLPYLSAAALKGWKGGASADGMTALVAKSLYSGKPPAPPKPDQWTQVTQATAGMLLFTDQFDAVLDASAGLAAQDSARIRRTVLRKDAVALDSEKAAFQEGCAERGVEAEGAEALWQAVCGSVAALQSRYVASACARTAMWLAYIRDCHPAAWITALLGARLEPWGRRSALPVAAIAADARKLGVTLKPPDVGYSRVLPALEREGGDWTVLWGLAQVPGWDREAAERFVAARPKRGFDSVPDFALAAHDAMLTREQLEGLVRSGGCDNLGGQARSREAIIEALPAWLKWAEADRGQGQPGGQLDLFGTAIAPVATTPDERDTLATPLSPRERYILRAWEIDHLGTGFTPAAEMDLLNRSLARAGDLRSNLLTSVQIGEQQVGKSICVVGLLTAVGLIEPPGGKGSDPMASAWIEDADGEIELVAFPPSYKRHVQVWSENNLVIVTGRVSKHADGAVYLLCEHVAPFYVDAEEAAITVKVKTGGRKKAASADKAKSETPVAVASAHASANGSHPGASPVTSHLPSTPPTPTTPPAAPTPAMSNASTPPTNDSTPGEGAGYKLVITLRASQDDRADIDLMIALKELLYEQPGPDTVTLRIPYSPETGHYTKAQLPRGVTYSAVLEADIVRLLGPDAVAVIKL